MKVSWATLELSFSCREAGEVRPTHSAEAKPRNLRRMRNIVHRDTVAPPPQSKVVQLEAQPVVTPDQSSAPKLDPETEKQCELQRQEFARRHIQRRHAFTLIWPLVCRRLEARPNVNATELFVPGSLSLRPTGRLYPSCPTLA